MTEKQPIAPWGDTLQTATQWLSLPGNVTSWLNLNPGIKLSRRADGRIRQQGTVRAAIMVIDDPACPAECNAGGKGNDKPDGTPMRCAQDYYDYFAEDARAFLRASSLGRMDIEVTLVKADTATGVFRLSGQNAHTYPEKRGGNVNTYVLEALDIAAPALRAAGDHFDVLYVVATENFEAISYGPTDVRGDKLRHIGLQSYGALVRIGQDSYLKFRKKAFIHELGHDLGLPDLYVDGAGTQLDAFSGKRDGFPAVGHWGMMSWINSPSHDFLGWEKWQMGWIEDDEVALLPPAAQTTVSLTTTALPGGTKLAVLPGPKPGVAYVIELKRAAGVDMPPIKEPGKPPLIYEGVLIYRVDANNATMHSPVTVCNLWPCDTPQQQAESGIDALARSTLGPASGRFSFEDKAAGITVSLPQAAALPDDPAQPIAVTITHAWPEPEARQPVLEAAAFLDLCTIECRTSFDLRGINQRDVVVQRAGQAIPGVTLDAVTPRTLRVRLPQGTLTGEEDMTQVALYTKAFSFYTESDSVAVAPAVMAPGPWLEGRLDPDGTVHLTADMSLEGYTPEQLCVMTSLGRRLAPSAMTLEIKGRSAQLRLDPPGGLDLRPQEQLLIHTQVASNYDPETAKARQMYFGARENGIVCRRRSNVLAL